KNKSPPFLSPIGNLVISPQLNSHLFSSFIFSPLQIPSSLFSSFQKTFTQIHLRRPEEMTSGSRMPTWKERENNKRRERRRRAIAAKIYSGLRMYGNYKLPKHCDNNEVLKALCNEAGWIVEEDGTTYRKGCRPVERMDILGGSTSASPCSSYQPSPCASYNPSPASSSFPSPISSHYTTTNPNGNTDANSLIPWLKNLSSSSSSSSSKHNHPHNLYIHTGSISAPVTPPLSSPTATSPPRKQNDWGDDNPAVSFPSWGPSSMPSSTPQSPGRRPDSAWLAGIQSGPSSPTFSLVARNPFGFRDEPVSGAGSRMWTPGQSGTCSPAVPAGVDHNADVPMVDSGMTAEFAFGCSNGGARLVKAWEGERIHEESISDDLELTLGNSKTR
ncbi:BES1/BZR1 homolog protein 4, partial [Linum perenne]